MRRPSRSKINWSAVKKDYLSTKELGLHDIANKYNLNYSTVKTVSMREGWAREKDRIWDQAATDAIEEAEGSVKDLIKRHAKVARFLQAGGLTPLKSIIMELKDHPDKVTKVVNPKMIQALTGVVAEGLKAERELYPKQMQVEGDLTIQGAGMSKALDKTLYGQFKRNLIRRPATRGDEPKAATKK